MRKRISAGLVAIFLLNIVMPLSARAQTSTDGYPVLQNALNNLITLTSFSFNSSTSQSLVDSSLAVNNAVTTINLNGAFDWKKDIKGNLTIVLSGRYSGSVIGGVLDLRYLNNVLYLRLRSVTGQDLLNVRPYVNRWVRFDFTKAFAQYSTPNNYSYSQSVQLNLQKELIRQMYKDVIATFISYQVFDIKYLQEENLGAIPTYHYVIGINKENLKKALPVIATKYKASDYEVRRASDSIDQLKLDDVELWIGKNTGYIHRFTGKTNQQSGTLTFSMLYDTRFYNMNAPVTVVKPLTSVTIDTIVKQWEQAQRAKSINTYPTY